MAKQKANQDPQTSDTQALTLTPALADAVKTNSNANVARVIQDITGFNMGDCKSFRDGIRRLYGYTSKKPGRRPFTWNDDAAVERLNHYADRMKRDA